MGIGEWDDYYNITSDDMDHARKFPTFSTSKFFSTINHSHLVTLELPSGKLCYVSQFTRPGNYSTSL